LYYKSVVKFLSWLGIHAVVSLQICPFWVWWCDQRCFITAAEKWWNYRLSM